MTFCRSDQFKSFYTRAQTFEFIRSKKACQNIFQKRDLLGPRTHRKNGRMQIFWFYSKSRFWMFDWWFQKLGESEPTPDRLALTFEFVRSKKSSFYDENVTLSPKVSIFHRFLKVFRKKCCCGCSGVGRATTALQPQHDFFRKCCKTNGFSNIFRQRRDAEAEKSSTSLLMPGRQFSRPRS